MSKTLLAVVALAFTISAAACSKKHDDQTQRLAKLCAEAGDTLEKDADSASPEAFQSLLSSTLEACSRACDGKDEPSCKALDDHMHIVCKTMPEACDQLCTTVKSPSLKKSACELGSKKR